MKEVSAAGPRVIRVDVSGSRFGGILSMESDHNVFVWVVIGSRDPLEFVVGAFVACPANEIAKVALLVSIVEL